MIKILWFGHKDYIDRNKRFSITSLPWDPRDEISGSINVHRIINLGRNGILKRRMIGSSFGCDELFREKDENYFELCEKTVSLANKYDVLVMSQYNYLHPHFLKKITSVKVLGMVDDPISTYDRSLVYAPFFDCCFHISQGYWEDLLMADLLQNFGLKKFFFLPLTNPELPSKKLIANDLKAKKRKIIYIGRAYGKKVDDLHFLKKELGNKFEIYGHWPFKGYYGYFRSLWGEKIFPYRINSINEEQKWDLYYDTKIGFNMHYTGIGNEDGNIRTYEILSSGGLLVTNRINPKSNLLNLKNGEDCIMYNSYSEAKDLLEYYLNHEDERIKIALNGHLKYCNSFNHNKNLNLFLDKIRMFNLI